MRVLTLATALSLASLAMPAHASLGGDQITCALFNDGGPNIYGVGFEPFAVNPNQPNPLVDSAFGTPECGVRGNALVENDFYEAGGNTFLSIHLTNLRPDTAVRIGILEFQFGDLDWQDVPRRIVGLEQLSNTWLGYWQTSFTDNSLYFSIQWPAVQIGQSFSATWQILTKKQEIRSIPESTSLLGLVTVGGIALTTLKRKGYVNHRSK
jgi:hypothetical protein